MSCPPKQFKRCEGLMKTKFIVLLLLCCALAAGQDKGGKTVPQGSSLPGLSSMPLGLNGPGFIEMGVGYSSVSDGFHNWADEYLRGVLSSGKKSFNGELTRQSRYCHTGWYYALRWERYRDDYRLRALELGSRPE